ncbi:DUF3862 domain-containing protein [Brevibacillus choshinensis]|uniref:DUF3862 domain-containing protein n=1 Tax=Brevibacillus choshinensis TaxID=54911 RepID=UPI002E1DE1C2|nr:DUF3862 domain-containing protein [Brevibacillus choshinensis]
MKFLKILGWIFVPYIMIGFQWNKIGSTPRVIGSVWAGICLIGLIANMGSDKQKPAPPAQTASAPAPEPAKQETPVQPAQTPAAVPVTAPAPAPKPENEGTMSKAEFDEIQNGMTYEEVVAIVGGPGEMLSESGNKGDQFYTEMYMWKGEGGIGANANAMFQSGKMTNKSQFGLK